jgi:hypothetical protein
MESSWIFDTKNSPIVWKLAKTVAKQKKWQKLYVEAQFESLKNTYQTIFET